MRDLAPARRCHAVLLGWGLTLGLMALAAPAQAQPFGSWLGLDGFPTFTGWVRVLHHPSLNPASLITIEAWVAIVNGPSGEDCRSIVGKNFQESYWVGLCDVGGQPTLRSYLRGTTPGSLKQGGQIEPGRWTHVAVVFNGTHRQHFINGELAASFAETGALPDSDSDFFIGSDQSWMRPPTGSIDEVRLWNVARTQAQIRANLDNPINTAQAGLVAVWSLDGNANDKIGARDGVVEGTGVGFLTFPIVFDCGPNTATTLCLLDRFQISARWRTNPAPGSLTDGQALVAGAANQGSGLFQFFSPTNWEIMVKALNGCGLNNRYWVFSAATTNVFYRLEVFDGREGAQKIYFNYPGPPAPAVTDTDAFATCP